MSEKKIEDPISSENQEESFSQPKNNLKSLPNKSKNIKEENNENDINNAKNSDKIKIPKLNQKNSSAIKKNTEAKKNTTEKKGKHSLDDYLFKLENNKNMKTCDARDMLVNRLCKEAEKFYRTHSKGINPEKFFNIYSEVLSPQAKQDLDTIKNTIEFRNLISVLSKEIKKSKKKKENKNENYY